MTRKQAIRELSNFLSCVDETMHIQQRRRWGRRKHELSLSGPLADELCLAADVTFGWGPNAFDWEERKSPFIEAVYTLLEDA